MKRIIKLFSLLSCVIALIFCIISLKQKRIESPVRNLDLSQENMDYQSFFNSFRNNKLEFKGNITKFTGGKQLEEFDLSFLDLISQEIVEEDLKEYVNFEFTYNNDLSKIIVTATINNGEEVLIENLMGYVFKNNDGQTDAIITLDDGSTVLLSELSDKYIDDCGWFSKLIKGVVSTVVAVVIVAVLPVSIPAVVAVAATAAATYGTINLAEQIKAENNYKHNITLKEPSAYVNGQSYYYDWKFGVSSLDNNGCGVIATYNVLRGLNKAKKLADVIYDFDYNSGTIASGLFGTDPSHYSTYFSKNHIKYKRYSSYASLQDGINNMSNDQMILVCAWNGDSIFDGAHYVAASYNSYSKRITVYNRFSGHLRSYSYSCFDKSIIGGDIIVAFIVG